MSKAREPLLYLILLSLWFGFFYGSSSLFSGWIPYRIPMPRPMWEFYPSWAVIYLSLNLLLVVAFFLTRQRATLFTALALQTVLAWPIFVVFPLQPIEISPPTSCTSFHLADTINLEGNYLPSLHVGYALTCALFLPRFWVFLWVMGVSLSTVLTYQHYPVDVLAGAVLALLAAWWARTRGRVFCLCLAELIRCACRHRRYALIGAGLLGHLSWRPRNGWKALVGFCYLQRVDDLLDGHLECQTEPENVASDQLKKWTTGEFGCGALDELGAALFRVLPERERIQAIIQEMILDRRRVRDNTLLTREELQQHLDRTFELSLDLMLIASGSELRAADVPALPSLLGWCSVVRDLDEDLLLGLVNVPVEEIGTAETWFQSELERARRLFEEARTQLVLLQGRSGYRLLGLFHRSVEKYIRSHSPLRAAQQIVIGPSTGCR